MGQNETDQEARPGATLLAVEAVCARVGLGRSTVYRLVDSGEFPRPVKLTAARVAWVEAEVARWVNRKIEERDQDG